MFNFAGLSSTLFRSNSAATKVITAYCNLPQVPRPQWNYILISQGRKYLKTALAKAVAAVCADPNRSLEAGDRFALVLAHHYVQINPDLARPTDNVQANVESVSKLVGLMRRSWLGLISWLLDKYVS